MYDLSNIPDKVLEQLVERLSDPKLIWELIKTGAKRGIAVLGSLLKTQNRINSVSVRQCMDISAKKRNTSTPVSEIKGDLAPYVQLKNRYYESFIDIASEINKSITKNSLSTETEELLALDKV